MDNELTKPLSELTMEQVRVIAESWGCPAEFRVKATRIDALMELVNEVMAQPLTFPERENPVPASVHTNGQEQG
jgi:hypothetical protein